MASGFKQATVDAGSVAATLSNFPAYVDLSRLGITTQAEADSVRVYADSGKTTEWAREIVSASEMHVKIPSLTSTTAIYVDWDGTSSDYAVTDTYGRNAVWSGFGVSIHGDAAIDSTGIQTVTTTVGSPTYGTTGQIGDAVSMDGNDALQFPSSTELEFGSGDFTISFWVRGDTWPAIASYDPWIWNLWQRITTTQTRQLIGLNDSKMRMLVSAGSVVSVGSAITVSTGVWYHVVAGRSGSTIFIQVNNETRVTASISGNIATASNPVVIGGNGNGSSFHLDGDVESIRAIKGAARSTDWVETEYNNQSDEATFWGTWTDAGGGATFIPKILSS